jgi:3-oxoacyl-[acyl-carrier protein] reductase
MPEPSRWILVAGGSRGLGLALAHDLARDHDVVPWSRTDGIDLLELDQVEAAALTLNQTMGPPRALLCTPGDFFEQGVLSTEAADWEALMRSNLVTAMNAVGVWVPRWKEAAMGARVILFGASSPGRAKRRAPAYFAAKAALRSAARSLAAELAPDQITVNVILPGLIVHEGSARDVESRLLPRVPLGRAGTVEDVIAVVRFLLSDGAAYLTGCEVPLDGGLHLGVNPRD